MTTARLRKLIERRQVACLWGPKDRHIITPRLVDTVFGDGKKLIGLAPTMFRPNHFVVRIDSAWNISNYARDCELLIDHLDEIYDEIEEQFTFWPWYRQYGMLLSRERGEDRSAYIDFSDGSAWWDMEFPKGYSSKMRSPAVPTREGENHGQ